MSLPGARPMSTTRDGLGPSTAPDCSEGGVVVVMTSNSVDRTAPRWDGDPQTYVAACFRAKHARVADAGLPSLDEKTSRRPPFGPARVSAQGTSMTRSVAPPAAISTSRSVVSSEAYFRGIGETNPPGGSGASTPGSISCVPLTATITR